MEINFSKYSSIIDHVNITTESGKVTEMQGLVIKGFLPGASVGSVCEITPRRGGKSFLAEVVGFKDRSVLLMPLGDMQGVGMGAGIVLKRQTATVPVGNGYLGRVLDGMGNFIDGGSPVDDITEVPIYRESRNPLARTPIRQPLDIGVRALNGLLTVGQGQRIGILAGSGVGKSVLLGMMARNTTADVNVIALIGERGREVREFIENDLGEEGLKRSVIIVATSDQSPLVRMRGAYVATSIAEYFAAQGKNVLFMMDSVTRFAMAQREVGLSAGEPPATKGYTPSVFATLPKLLERAGAFEGEGSITGLYTTLVEGDDMDDPIGDTVRSIVDGHIVLTRKLAQKGHFPAIDVLQSASRVMRQVSEPAHIHLAQKFREVLATYSEAEDLINIGAYTKGANKKIDQAVEMIEDMRNYLKQAVEEPASFEDSINYLEQIMARAR